MTMERENTNLPPLDPLSIDLALNPKIFVGRVDMNVTQDFIIITAERARLVLRDAVHNMERSTAWQTPLGILATIVVALPVTAFHFRISSGSQKIHGKRSSSGQ